MTHWKYSKRLIMSAFLGASLMLSSCGGGSGKSSGNYEKSNTSTNNSSSTYNKSSSSSSSNYSTDTQAATSTKKAAKVDLSKYKPLAGKELNKFFPKSGSGYDVNFAQEKTGTSQAKLKKAGKEVATLTLTDLASNPKALDKYMTTSTKIGVYPSSSVGSLGSSIVVGSRFQVQVRAKDKAFSATDRENWIKKFDLKGLEALSPIKSNDLGGGNQASSSTAQTSQATATPSFGLDLSKYKPLAGKEFNKFFPSKSSGYDVNFAQEKVGTSQAKLKKSGKEVATLTVTDLASNPKTRDKYLTTSTKVGNYPSTTVGSLGTSILVGERFQVQVRSKDQTFSASDREAWLKKFNLTSIANLKTKNQK